MLVLSPSLHLGVGTETFVFHFLPKIVMKKVKEAFFRSFNTDCYLKIMVANLVCSMLWVVT